MVELQQLRGQQPRIPCEECGERECPDIQKLQDLALRYIANCCEDNQASMRQAHQCPERCRAPPAPAQALVTSESERFQDRLARRAMHCNDKATDSMDAGSEELQVKQQLGSSVAECVEDHTNLTPTMTKRMKESLSSIGK